MKGHLYLLVFANDPHQYIKVGSTKHLDQRISSLRTEARHFGYELRFAWATEPTAQYRALEASVLDAFAHQRRGDYLRDVDARQVLHKARQIADEPGQYPCPPGLNLMDGAEHDLHGAALPLLLPAPEPGFMWIHTGRFADTAVQLTGAEVRVLLYFTVCAQHEATVTHIDRPNLVLPASAAACSLTPDHTV